MKKNEAEKRPPPERLWSTKDLKAHFDVSMRTVYRITQRPDFPKPSKNFGHKRWAPSEIKRYTLN